MIVALFGPDGSGKSSLVSEFSSTLDYHHISHTKFHWRPRLLASLNKSKDANGDFSTPDENIVRGRFISVVCYIYFYLDFLAFSVTEKLKKMNSRSTKVILYERYFYDAIFHPRRYKLENIPWLANFLSSILPKPDLIVLLSGSAEIIHSRKAELSKEEITRQILIMKKTLPKYGQIIELDVDIHDTNNISAALFDIAFPEKRHLQDKQP